MVFDSAGKGIYLPNRDGDLSKDGQMARVPF